MNLGFGGYSSRATHTPRILVVDDEDDQRRLYSRRLCFENYQTFSAASGLDALTRIQALRPDLVLADIRMPKINGIQMLKIMRQAPQTATIPMILMTGMPILESVLEAAADGLKTGPIHVKGNFKQLFELINNRLHLPVPVTGALSPEGHLFQKRSVTVDLLHRKVMVAGLQAPRLTTKLFDLLVALLSHDGPVDQDVLLTEVWGHKSSDTKLVTMTMGRLREALHGFSALQIRTDAHSYELLIVPLPTKVAH